MAVRKGDKTKVAKSGKSQGSDRTLKLGRDVRIATAAAIFNAFREASLSKEASILIDGGQVEKADTAGLQAVLAGRRALEDAGKKSVWTGCAPQLRSAAELLGIAQALELPR